MHASLNLQIKIIALENSVNLKDVACHIFHFFFRVNVQLYIV